MDSSLVPTYSFKHFTELGTRSTHAMLDWKVLAVSSLDSTVQLAGRNSSEDLMLESCYHPSSFNVSGVQSVKNSSKSPGVQSEEMFQKVLQTVIES